MNAPRYARLAGRLFVQERRSIPPAPPAMEARAKAIAAIEHAIVTRRRRLRITAWTTRLAAVAAAAVAVLVIRREWVERPASVLAVSTPTTEAPIVAHPVGAGARVVFSGTQVPLPDGGALRSGSRILTPTNGGVSLTFTTGTSVALGAWGDMTLIGDGAAQIVRLDSGSVDLHVAKLSAGQRFLVDTPDAEVEVRGTRFKVSIVPADPSCGHGTWTRVSVTEGVVEVRHAGSAARVSAGAEWPIDCGRTVSLLAPQPKVGTTAVPPSPPVRSQRATTRTGAGISVESTLGAQNNLFAQAAATKRSGDVLGAIALLDRFLAIYPTSPLTESVMVERMRLLRTVDLARGAAAATQYLVRYPNGFAHVEAESMVAEAP
jgi:hypothetical protein